MDVLERCRGAAAVVLVVIVVVIVLYQAEDSGYGVESLRGEDVAIGGSCCEVGSGCRSIGGAGDEGEEGEEACGHGGADKGIAAPAPGTPFLEVGIMFQGQVTDLVKELAVTCCLGVDDFFYFLFCLHVFFVLFAIFDMMRCFIFLTAAGVVSSFSAISFWW